MPNTPHSSPILPVPPPPPPSLLLLQIYVTHVTHCQYSPLSPFPFYKDKQRDQKLYLLKVYYRLHLNYCLSQSYNSASLCISSDRNTVLSPF